MLAASRRENAIPYDIPDVELGHHGQECSVEAILLDSKTGFLRAGADWRQPAYAMVS